MLLERSALLPIGAGRSPGHGAGRYLYIVEKIDRAGRRYLKKAYEAKCRKAEKPKSHLDVKTFSERCKGSGLKSLAASSLDGL